MDKNKIKKRLEKVRRDRHYISPESTLLLAFNKSEQEALTYLLIQEVVDEEKITAHLKTLGHGAAAIDDSMRRIRHQRY